MAKIEFKAKPEQGWDLESGLPYARVRVPNLARRHCDMDAFRRHTRYQSYANSDLFPAMLAGIAKDVAPAGYLRLDKLPSNVTADTGAFLTTVRIEV